MRVICAVLSQWKHRNCTIVCLLKKGYLVQFTCIRRQMSLKPQLQNLVYERPLKQNLELFVGPAKEILFHLRVKWRLNMDSEQHVSKSNIQKQLRLSREMLRKDPLYWNIVLWSEESKINLFQSDVTSLNMLN